MAKRRYSFWIDEEQLEGLRELRTRLGVSESEQIRRALADWLSKQGGGRPVLMDLTTGTFHELRAGQVVTVPCVDCGGALMTDKDFVLRHRSLGKPEKRESFWSTKCVQCSNRFNLFPETGRLQRIHKTRR